MTTDFGALLPIVLLLETVVPLLAALPLLRLARRAGRWKIWSLILVVLLCLTLRSLLLFAGAASGATSLAAEALLLAVTILLAVALARMLPLVLERVQVAEEQRRVHQEVSDLYEHAPCGYHSLDRDGRFVRINDTELEWLGYRREEVLDRLRFVDVVTPASRQFFLERFPRFMQEGVLRDVEIELVRKDGSVLPVLISATAVRDRQGNYVMSRSTVYDRSEQLRAEDERRGHLQFLQHMDRINRVIQGAADLEQMMRDTLDAVLDIFACDRASLIYPCDPEAPSWTAPMECNRPEYPGVLTMGLEVPADEGSRQVFSAVLQNEGAVQFGAGAGQLPLSEILRHFGIQAQMAMALHPKVGSPWMFVLHQCSAPRQWSTEEQRLFREIGRRIADGLTGLLIARNLRQALDEIHAAKEQWEKTFDAIEDVVTIHDRDMRVVRANRAAGLLLCRTPDELLSRSCYELFRGASTPCDNCPELLSRRDLANHHGVIRHDNLGKVFAVSIFPVVEQGVASGFVHIAKDITQQLQLEERLRQSQKLEAIGTLAGGIAHDFNNLLAPIMGYAELGLQRLAADDPLRAELQQVVDAALRAKGLVSQILAFSRRAPQEKVVLEPRPVIREALKLLRAFLPSTIEIREDIAVDSGAVMVDPTQLHQIIMNLCTNAFHAMRETGGVLGVRLAPAHIGPEDAKVLSDELAAGAYVKIEVSDTGCGIERRYLARIFEPYFTTKATGEGTGLGLSVVHGIVKSYQGHVTAYSEPGQGSVFRVYLPLVEHVAARTQPATGLSSLATGTERLLVVDDEEIITGMLRAVLSSLGYRVSVCGNGLEALAIFSRSPDEFDLMLTDMTMPGLTGFEVARQVLTLRPNLPVILCTGFSELVTRELALAHGIREFLMKPVQVQELAATVRRALDNAGATAAA